MEKRTAGTLTYTATGLCILFFWLLFGEFAMAVRERAAVPSVLELLRQHNSSNTLMTALVTVLPAIIGILLVPVVSYRSDRYRSRLGRRLPFLIIPTPIAALAIIGIGFAPLLGRELHALLGPLGMSVDACVLTVFALFWTIFECMAIVTLYIFTGLINDVVPKGLLGRFYGLFRTISLGAGIMFNSMIFKLTETHLQEIFIGVGVFYGIGFTLMCLMVREGEYPEPAPEEGGGRPPGLANSVRIYFVECFSHAHYLWVFGALSMAVMVTGPFSIFNAYSQWYAGSLGMPKSTLGNLTATAFAVSMVLAFFIGWVVDKTSALKVSMVSIGVYAIATLGGYFVTTDADSFAGLYMAHVLLASTYNTAAASLPMLLFPRMRFLQFASAAFLMTSVVGIIGNGIMGPILDFTGHNYRLTILASSLFAFLTLAALFKVRHNLRTHPGEEEASPAASGHAGGGLLKPA